MLDGSFPDFLGGGGGEVSADIQPDNDSLLDTAELSSANGSLRDELRAAAAECFKYTMRTELGRAEALCDEWCGHHPRMVIEWGHVNLARAVLDGDASKDATAIDIYLSAAEAAEGVQQVTVKKKSAVSDFTQRWSVWASASAAAIGGRASPRAERTAAWRPLKPLPVISPCPHLREEARAAEEEVVSRTGGDGTQQPSSQEAAVTRKASRYSSEAQTSVDWDNCGGTTDTDGEYEEEEVGPESGASAQMVSKWTAEAVALSDAVDGRLSERSAASESTVPGNGKDQEMVLLAAEARTLAALLMLKCNRYIDAGANLHLAWVAYQPFRRLVRAGGGGLPGHLADDVRVGVGLILATAVELPDGLRKVLGTAAPLAPTPAEEAWLLDVFTRGGPRALHAGACLVLRQLARPRSLLADGSAAAAEDQVLRALLLGHPNSVLLHLVCSTQRRRHADPRGALDAVAAARRAWSSPSSVWHAGRALKAPVPAAVTMAAADAHFGALQYQEAAKAYRATLDIGIVQGESLTFQGRAAIRLAGAMTMLGMQRWASEPWGFADEWILRSVSSARSDRQEEEAAASVAARFSHHSYLRPLLPFWLLFLMGDLETCGTPQRRTLVALLERLATNNPSRPPKEDFMAFAEGRAMHRLLLGAAVRGAEPARARELWTETLVDGRVPSSSVSLAYTQCLLGEEEVKTPHRVDLGVRMLIKGSQLPGDKSPQLRLRYGAALQALPWEYLAGLVPLAWSVVLRTQDDADADESARDTQASQSAADMRRAGSSYTQQWLKPVMQKRSETIDMVNTLLGRLNTTVNAPASLAGSVNQPVPMMAWRRPPELTTAGARDAWSRPALESDDVKSVRSPAHSPALAATHQRDSRRCVSLTLPPGEVDEDPGRTSSRLLACVQEVLH